MERGVGDAGSLRVLDKHSYSVAALLERRFPLGGFSRVRVDLLVIIFARLPQNLASKPGQETIWVSLCFDQFARDRSPVLCDILSDELAGTRLVAASLYMNAQETAWQNPFVCEYIEPNICSNRSACMRSRIK